MILISVFVSLAGLISVGDKLALSVAIPGVPKSTLNFTFTALLLVKVMDTGLPLTGTPFSVRLKLRV